MSTLKVQIPDPCRQRWDTMQPGEQGRFCQNCQKTVVDFTSFSDRALARQLHTSGQAVCGRFRPDQLNRVLPVVTPTTSSSWSQRIGLFILGLIGWQTAQAQSAPNAPVPTTTRPQTPISAQAVINAVSPETEQVIKGSVLHEEDGKFVPIPGASVVIKGTSRGADTDQTGHFQLVVSAKPKGNVVLVIKSPGFMTQEIDCKIRKSIIKILLKENDTVLGETVVVQSGWWKQAQW